MATKTQMLQKQVNEIASLSGATIEHKSDGFYLRKCGVTLAWFKTYIAGVNFLNQTKDFGRGNYAMLRK